MDNFDLKKYLAEGRLFEEKDLEIGDKGTIETTDLSGDESENSVVVIPNPSGKEEEGIVWVRFLDGEFEGEISSYNQDAIKPIK
tara:strand:+ start:214 stop:465 length:252 start_codon:yes stop_codon:yes gene_type:complete